jgi:hypothetical protein
MRAVELWRNICCPARVIILTVSEEGLFDDTKMAVSFEDLFCENDKTTVRNYVKKKNKR